MKLINKLERRFGRYAIPNLTRYIIFAYILGYLLRFTNQTMFGFFTLDVAQVFHGQVWRIVTWLLIPPSEFGLFTAIMLFVYFSLGTNLERTWGDFRYNLYIFGGILTTLLGAFILYIITLLLYGPEGAAIHSLIFSPAFSTYYVSLSIFLGFAMTYPEMRMMLFFLIPIKIKYLGIVNVLFLLWSIFQSVMIGDWASCLVIVCSLLNVIIFFLATRNIRLVSPSEIRRKQNFRAQTKQGSWQPKGALSKGSGQVQSVKRPRSFSRAEKNSPRHKCAICGRTELDGDNLEFRFCSKCDGNYEYCQDHLFTHEHVKKRT